jgi:K+-transporting ATPase ATPase A chain
MHSSLSPLSGAVAMFNMMLGEIIFGGVGAGMYGMLRIGGIKPESFKSNI